LDEPTSGLDAFTSASIIDVLKGLADEGRTIIFTIHQPRSDLFKQFGSLLLLTRGGDVVYSGRAAAMVSHFESLGFPCPGITNPADFALDLVTVDLQEAAREASTGKKVSGLVTSWTAAQLCPIADETQISAPAALGSLARRKSPFFVSLSILIHRGIINLRRQPNLITGRISQLVGLGIVLTAFFAPLRNDYYSVQTRMGYVQDISSIFFVGMLNSIAMYPPERAIFYHEDADNMYPLEAFFIYYSILEIPMELMASILFSLLTVLAAGLPRTASMFFLMAYNAFCVVSCGESFGIFFLTLFSHTGLAVSVMSVVLSISVHLGGVISLSVPAFLQAMNHLSPVKWQVGSLASYSLRGIEFTCTDAQRLGGPHGPCPIQTGEQVLALYGLDVNTGTYVLSLGGVTLGYRILAYLVLKIRRTNWMEFKLF
jgi:ABC-type multidrug transport system permease subunit